MNHRLVFQPAELRCRSDKLSAVNTERRCRGEQAGGLRDAPWGGRRRLRGAGQGSHPCELHGATPVISFLSAFFLLMEKLKPFLPLNAPGRLDVLPLITAPRVGGKHQEPLTRDMLLSMAVQRQMAGNLQLTAS